MTQTIKVMRKDLIAKLSSIKDDNVSIAGIAISRQRLLEALKLQTQDDIININYGLVSWHYDYKMKHIRAKYQDDDDMPSSRDGCEWVYEPYTKEPEPCIQISCNHTVMRFLNKPKTKSWHEPKVIPLNFVDHLDTTKPELTGIPLDTQELIRALTFVLPCVATETTRPVLNCVLLDSDDDTIKMVAADGFRLGISKVAAKGIPADKVLIQIVDIQRLLTFLKAVKPMGKGKSKCYPETYLAHDYKTVKISTEQGSIELGRQKYTFPDYEKLIPKDGTKIGFIASDMLRAAKALSRIANDGSGIISLQFNTGQPCGKIRLSAKSGYDENESSSECDALVESDCKIAVNARYLTDLLTLCKDTRAIMRLTTPSSPMLFNISDDKQWLVMPMFVQWEDKET